jgi:hypothetical protein
MPQGIYKNLLLDQLALKMNMARDRLMPEKVVVTAPKKSMPRHNVRLTPTESAIQMLLHQPALALMASASSTVVHESSDEKKLLIDLMQRCVQNPDLQVSELLSEIEDESKRAMIALIASYPMHVPVDGQAAELAGALQRLHEQDQERQLSRLIEKAKSAELDLEEKQLLQLLLANKHAAKILA